MYKKFLYNDDCVLDLKLNKVIYDFNDEYEDYLQWKEENPNLDYIITKERDGKLKWNQGVPIKKDNEELYYQLNGKLFRKKIYKNDILVKELEYFTEDNLNYDAEIVYKELRYSKGRVTDEIRYYYFPRNVQTHIIFDEPTDECKFSFYKKELDIEGKLNSELECKEINKIKYFKEITFDAIGNIKTQKEWEE